MNQRLRSTNSLLAMCGMVAPVLFALAVIVLGFLREDYSHVSDTISDLGEIGSPNMAGQNVNFILTGLLILAFSFGLYRGTDPGKRVKVGSLLVAVIGLGVAGAGVFPDDPSCPSPGCNSLAANGHGVAGFMVFPAIPFAILLFARGLGRDTAWRRYRTYSLVTGIVALALLVLFDASESTLASWEGAIQRLYLVSWFQWIGVMAIGLFRLSGSVPCRA